MKKSLLLLSILTQIPFANATDIVSRRLEDTIKKGVGDLNLMRRSTGRKIITGAELEAFRQSNNGKLVFSVDVNESSKGSENRNSQGVAVESASIDVRIDGVVQHFDNFSTKTKSSLAKTGTTNRQFYYTLLGDAGSSHITSRIEHEGCNDDHKEHSDNCEENGQSNEAASADSTLTIPVNVDLSKATSAYVHFRFLDTNTRLGDPEAFYDFSGGFEDVALITNTDSTTLDTLKPGWATAPLVVPTASLCTICSHSYYPSSTDYYLAAYEDQFPKTGDYDFNDLLVAYRVSYGLDIDNRVKTIDGEGYLVARGGAYNLDWYLNIPLPNNTTGTGDLKIFAPNQTTPMAGYPQSFQVKNSLNLKVFNNLKSLFVNPQTSQVNTIWNTSFVPGHKFKFSITLDVSVNPNQLGSAPFDPYVFIQNTGYEIHLPGKTTLLSNSLNKSHKKTEFIDANNFPYALIMPSDWVWTNEYVNITKAYPQFVNFINSNNQTNLEWYKNGVPSGLTKLNKKWQW